MGEAGLKDHTWLDFMYMKCPEQASLQRQEVGQWLPRRRGWRVTADEFSFFWGPDENILKLDGGEGCVVFEDVHLKFV